MMETKICLVPTRTLYPVPKKEKKIKPARIPSPKRKLAVEARPYEHKETSSQSKIMQDLQVKGAGSGFEHTFLCDFPRASNYSDMDSVTQTFPHLKTANKPNLQLDRVTDLKCFIMRSNNEDDIHKAIKYGIWTSTQRSNEFLNTMYQECSGKNAPIFLLYSVVRSGQFSAVAQLSSGIKEKHFQFWWEDKKWMNHFEVKWIFIKDVPYKCFNQFTMDDDTPVIRARDCTSIPVETAKDMLKVFRDYRSSTNIFDAFAYMDIREDMLRHYRYSLQSYQNRISARKASKALNSQPSSAPKMEPFSHLDMLLKEFELMLTFYQREKVKMQQEIEDIVRQVTIEEQFLQEDLEDLLPDYHDLKSKEKEMEEGFEELDLKYEMISRCFNETNDDFEKSQAERNSAKLEELEKIYRNLKDSFAKDKENMYFFSQKILQLNVSFFQYSF